MDDVNRSPVTVLIADDHEMILAGVEYALGSDPHSGCKVVAKTARQDQVVDLYEAQRPNVVVLDIRFGPDSRAGLELARKILRVDPQAKIISYSQFDQVETAAEAISLGCKGFVNKAAQLQSLIAAIRRVARGEMHVPTEVRQYLEEKGAGGFGQNGPRVAITTQSANDDHVPERHPQTLLNEREYRQFCLLAQGMTIEGMAMELGVSPRTVSGTTRVIKNKLGVVDIQDIIVLGHKFRIHEVTRAG